MERSFCEIGWRAESIRIIAQQGTEKH